MPSEIFERAAEIGASYKPFIDLRASIFARFGNLRGALERLEKAMGVPHERALWLFHESDTAMNGDKISGTIKMARRDETPLVNVYYRFDPLTQKFLVTASGKLYGDARSLTHYDRQADSVDRAIGAVEHVVAEMAKIYGHPNLQPPLTMALEKR
jgi:hypothetical protein